MYPASSTCYCLLHVTPHQCKEHVHRNINQWTFFFGHWCTVHFDSLNLSLLQPMHNIYTLKYYNFFNIKIYNNRSYMPRLRSKPSSGSSQIVPHQVTKMVSVNSTSLPKSFGFAAVCQFIPVCVCARPGTHHPHVTWAHVMLTREVGMWEAI